MKNMILRFLLLAATSAGVAAAQPSVTPARVAADSIRQGAQSPNRSRALTGLRFGGPARMSFAVGPAYLIKPALGENARTERAAYLFVLAEPGIRAGRVSVGYTTTEGNLYTTRTVRGSLLRHWSSSDELLVGAELSGTIVALGPRIGVFTAVAGARRGSVLVVWDFGLGI